MSEDEKTQSGYLAIAKRKLSAELMFAFNSSLEGTISDEFKRIGEEALGSKAGDEVWAKSRYEIYQCIGGIIEKFASTEDGLRLLRDPEFLIEKVDNCDICGGPAEVFYGGRSVITGEWRMHYHCANMGCPGNVFYEREPDPWAGLPGGSISLNRETNRIAVQVSNKSEGDYDQICNLVEQWMEYEKLTLERPVHVDVHYPDTEKLAMYLI